ncbi:MAG: DUF3995 domain-containing protein [Flavobacteriaceae bacterium]|nr:DUF3995 domain-containing protein [Flavobacteriaceae bacterium]
MSLLLFITFTILGCFHFYWFFGGTWGLKKAIPTKSNDVKLKTPPKFATLFVALVLASFALVYLIKSELIIISTNSKAIRIAYWVIPILFIIRAVGEFNYIGFLKKVKDTEFAKADSNLFSPLCLGIGMIGIIIQLLTK